MKKTKFKIHFVVKSLNLKRNNKNSIKWRNCFEFSQIVLHLPSVVSKKYQTHFVYSPLIDSGPSINYAQLDQSFNFYF